MNTNSTSIKCKYCNDTGIVVPGKWRNTTGQQCTHCESGKTATYTIRTQSIPLNDSQKRMLSVTTHVEIGGAPKRVHNDIKRNAERAANEIADSFLPGFCDDQMVQDFTEIIERAFSEIVQPQENQITKKHE